MTTNTHRPKKRSLVRAAEQILKVAKAHQMPVTGIEVDLDRNLIAVRITSSPATMKNEEQDPDEALATWKVQHSPSRHP